MLNLCVLTSPPPSPPPSSAFLTFSLTVMGVFRERTEMGLFHHHDDCSGIFVSKKPFSIIHPSSTNLVLTMETKETYTYPIIATSVQLSGALMMHSCLFTIVCSLSPTCMFHLCFSFIMPYLVMFMYETCVSVVYLAKTSTTLKWVHSYIHVHHIKSWERQCLTGSS